LQVARFAVRGWKEPLPDAEDRSERDRTRYVLRAGPAGLLLATLATLAREPRRFLAALALAVRTSRDSDRPLLYHLVYLIEACQVLRWLRESDIQHIHAHFGTNSTDVAMLVNALGGPPYSFTVHGPEEFYRAVGLRDKIARAAFVVTISSFCRSQTLLWSRFSDWPKIRLVRCGIEKSFYEGARAPTNTAARMICVGRLAPEKGHLVLIEALAQLARRGVQCELVFAGDGPLRGQLEELIALYGLEDRVRITGWISSSQVRDELLAARVLIQPSFAEGLPVVLMEAMALQLPVIATYIAGIPELVVNGESGWLVPAASAEALAAAIEQCLSRTTAELQTMGRLGQARVIANHAIDTEAEILAELFSSAATVAPPGAVSPHPAAVKQGEQASGP
jgi:colanic acid/amylovoran biosynthesis glycosyltransferase